MESNEVLMRIRRIKGECIVRNAGFRADVEEFIRERPTWEEFESWDGGRQMELEMKTNALVRKWGCGSTDAWSVTERPAGDPALAPATFRTLSAPYSRVLVVAIDLGHDAESVMPNLERWFVASRKALREVRQDQSESEPLTDWSEYRYGPDRVAVLEEVVQVWDLKEAGKAIKEIASEVFPGKPADAGYASVRKRLKEAKRLIEEEGFRDILPLDATYASLDWLMDFTRTRGAPVR